MDIMDHEGGLAHIEVLKEGFREEFMVLGGYRHGLFPHGDHTMGGF